MRRKNLLSKMTGNAGSNKSVAGIFPNGMMTVRQMGDMLGLKKTERYWLIKKGYFKTEEIQGKIFIHTDSFEDWYKNQLTYHKISGEAPGSCHGLELHSMLFR